jgi:hypothetical protein
MAPPYRADKPNLTTLLAGCRLVKAGVLQPSPFLGVFIVYQVYRLRLKPSVGPTALTIFDAVIAWLTYHAYRKRLTVARR